MQHIETVTVGSGGAASITFSAIPDTFTDLFLVLSVRGTGGVVFENNRVTFNSSTTNYTDMLLFGTGSSTASATNPSPTALSFSYYAGASSTANTFSNSSIYIPNYTAAAAKSASIDSVTENNATSSIQSIAAWLWNDTSAIHTISMTGAGSTYVENSTVSLYGITAGSDGIVTVS